MPHAGARKSSFLDNAFVGGSGSAPPAIRRYLLVPKLPHRRHNCPVRFKEEARRPLRKAARPTTRRRSAHRLRLLASITHSAISVESRVGAVAGGQWPTPRRFGALWRASGV